MKTIKNQIVKQPTNVQEAFKVLDDPLFRREVAKEDFSLFFKIYFTEYIKYDLAPMHNEMFEICQSDTISLALIMAFRGSGKSTIVSTAYPLWAVLGTQQKKFIVLITKTKIQAKQIMRNIRSEAENNQYLKSDLGPFVEESDEWGSEAIVFDRQQAKIMVISMEQSIKGLRHKHNRPDLIILDDVEDNESVKTRDQRDKTKEKYLRDIVPLGDKNTKIIHIGNLLSNYSLIMSLKDKIEEDSTTEVFKRFPIVDELNVPYWPGKYPTYNDILIQKDKIKDEVAWHLEYMLKVMSGVHQIIRPEYVQYYDQLPARQRNRYGEFTRRYIYIGVDLAISQKDSADYTAITPILFEKDFNNNWKSYILENHIRERMDFSVTADSIIYMYKALSVYNCPVTVIVEDVGFQKAIGDIIKLKNNNQFLRIENVNTATAKETRLRTCQPLFASMSVFFPSRGSEYMVQELLGFGQENHDDVVDSISIALNYAVGNLFVRPRIIIAE